MYSHMNLCVLVYEPTIGRYVVPGLAKNATLIQEAAVTWIRYLSTNGGATCGVQFYIARAGDR